MNPESMEIGELTAYICTHLKNNGIDVVLSGDGCVSIYTRDKYQADDLDFIESAPSGKERLAEVLSLIGFASEQKHSRHFVHPEARLSVEFPSGPLMVGEELPGAIRTLVFETGELRLLSPTDCIKDRLLWFFNDPHRQADHPCLSQALMVAQDNDIDYRELERWADQEGERAAYRVFERCLIK